MSLIPRTISCSDTSMKNSENENLVLKRATSSQPFIGTWEEAPQFLRDNEFVKKGYRINFNSVKRIVRSLFMLHNESMNVWSHLLGVLLFVCLVGYVAIWIRPKFVFPNFESIKVHLGISQNITYLYFSGPILEKNRNQTSMTNYEKVKDFVGGITDFVKDYAEIFTYFLLNYKIANFPLKALMILSKILKNYQ